MTPAGHRGIGRMGRCWRRRSRAGCRCRRSSRSAARGVLADVVIDFTHAEPCRPHAPCWPQRGVGWVLGTSGLSAADEAPSRRLDVDPDRLRAELCTRREPGAGLGRADGRGVAGRPLRCRDRRDAPPAEGRRALRHGDRPGPGRRPRPGRRPGRCDGQRPRRPHRPAPAGRHRVRRPARRPGGGRAHPAVRRGRRAHRADPPGLRPPRLRGRRRAGGAVGRGAAAGPL